MSIGMRFPIIKVVGNSCNLTCDYCFYSGKEKPPACIISDELIESFIAQFMEIFSGRMRFVWHGGEPLLAGIPFFERVISYENKYLKNGDSVENLLQTNAVLINDSWAQFFKDNGFRIGVSLDGNQRSHDLFRKNRNGGGSFQRTMRGVKTLKRFGIMPGIIQTLTRSNIANIEEDFRFFTEELGAKGWAINIYESNSSLNGRMRDEGLSDQEVTEVYKKLINLWLKRNDPNLRIREIENFVPGALNRRAKNCSYNGSCASYFCLDFDGSVYPCDRLSSDESSKLGDLRQTSLREVLQGELMNARAKKVQTFPVDCLVCEWKNACNNGCLAMRDGTTGKFTYCRARQQTLDFLKQLLYTDCGLGNESHCLEEEGV